MIISEGTEVREEGWGIKVVEVVEVVEAVEAGEVEGAVNQVELLNQLMEK